MTTDPADERRAFKAHAQQALRDPGLNPDPKQRAIMACVGLPDAIQKWIVDAGALDGLIDQIAATIVASETAARRQAIEECIAIVEKENEAWHFTSTEVHAALGAILDILENVAEAK